MSGMSVPPRLDASHAATPPPAASVSAATGSGRVQSVDRALKLLSGVVAAAPYGETAAVLAADCDINRATAWRLLGTLEAHGLIERDPSTNRYKIGLALLRMSAAAGYEGLVRKTRHILERVSAQTGETADLAIAGLRGVTYIGEVAPPSVMAINWLAREVPLHATSTGKAFLGWLPPEEALAMLEKPLRKFTDTTITDRERLLDELARTRSRGYAECAGELEATLFGVSAPILDVTGTRPVAVFSIWGPVNRVTVDRFAELGPIAIDAAHAIRATMIA